MTSMLEGEGVCVCMRFPAFVQEKCGEKGEGIQSLDVIREWILTGKLQQIPVDGPTDCHSSYEWIAFWGK